MAASCWRCWAGWARAREQVSGTRAHLLRKKQNKADSKKRVISYRLFPSANQAVLTHNKSGRFESRFVSVGIQESPSVWLRGMEGSALGVWVAHGEGTVNTHSQWDL